MAETTDTPTRTAAPKGLAFRWMGRLPETAIDGWAGFRRLPLMDGPDSGDCH